MGAEVSDVSVSSVHTSDISELEDLSADHQGLSDYSDDQEGGPLFFGGKCLKIPFLKGLQFLK